MLPTMLPDAVCVFFDLQGHPVDTPAGFFQALARETLGQARRDRGLTLPPLPEGPPFESASAWLESLEETAGERRILLCLDEFETLEKSFPGSRRQLLQLMGLFRATIQHRRRVRLLVAGEAPFDELDAVWNDHFISVREVRIGHLDPETARELVRRPSDDFPEDALPDAVAERIVERTGAQPYLVQLYAQLLVDSSVWAHRLVSSPSVVWLSSCLTTSPSNSTRLKPRSLRPLSNDRSLVTSVASNWIAAAT